MLFAPLIEAFVNNLGIEINKENENEQGSSDKQCLIQSKYPILKVHCVKMSKKSRN